MKYIDDYITDLDKIKKTYSGCELLRNKSILITGAGGLICSAIVDFLMCLNKKYNYKINVYVAGRNKAKIEKRFENWKERSEFYFFQYDAIKKIETKIYFDYIIHGASPASPAFYSSQPVETMLANFYGINNLLEYIVNNGDIRLLYISSSEVYGKKNEKKAYHENDYNYIDILNSRSCYPSSKRAAETLCASYREEYGVDYVIVRPGHVYGPTMTENDNRASSQFPRDVKAGKDITMKSAGMQLRSYCYVLDCVSAIILVLLNGVSGEAYNISNKNSVVTIREMAESFAEISGKNIIFQNPSDDEKASYNMMNNSSLTSDKLERLGWIASYDLKTGVKKTYEGIYKL